MIIYEDLNIVLWFYDLVEGSVNTIFMLHFSQAKNCTKNCTKNYTKNLQISFRGGVYGSLIIAFQKMPARICLSLFGRAKPQKQRQGSRWSGWCRNTNWINRFNRINTSNWIMAAAGSTPDTINFYLLNK